MWLLVSQNVSLQSQLMVATLHFSAPIPPPPSLAQHAQQPMEATDDLLDALNVDNAPVLMLTADLVPNSLLPHATVRQKFYRCYAQLVKLHVAHLNSSPMHMVVCSFSAESKYVTAHVFFSYILETTDPLLGILPSSTFEVVNPTTNTLIPSPPGVTPWVVRLPLPFIEGMSTPPNPHLDQLICIKLPCPLLSETRKRQTHLLQHPVYTFRQGWVRHNLISCLFVAGNSSIRPLLEGRLSPIHTNLSSRFSAGIEPGIYG